MPTFTFDTLSAPKRSPADHEFFADVLYDDEANVWTASCPEIGVFTEADTLEQLQERFMLIAPEMALENAKMSAAETAHITFVQRELA